MDTKKRAIDFLERNIEEDQLGDPSNTGSLGTSIRDLLADLMHICEDKGLSFPDLLDGANEVFFEEFKG